MNNPDNLVEAFNSPALGGRNTLSVKYSHDGGVSWGDPTAPPDLGASQEAGGDPITGADAAGTFYAGGIRHAPDANGLSLTDAVSTSTDGGVTWGPTVTAVGPSSLVIDPDNGPVQGVSCWDRPWFATDLSTGDVYISCIAHGDAISVDLGLPPVFNETGGRRYVSVSHDHGQTWGPLYPLDDLSYPDSQAFEFAVPSSARGVLAAAYSAKSAPGVTCGTCVVFETSADHGATWSRGLLPQSMVVGSGQPFFAADPSTAGRYALMLKTSSSLEVYVTTDSGASWQGPAAVAAGAGNTTTVPWMAYAPNGALGVGYKVRHANGTFAFWGAVAPKGDTAFGPPVQISSADSPSSPCGSTCDDFSNITMDNYFLDAAWGDARDTDTDGHMESWFGRYNFAADPNLLEPGTTVPESPWQSAIVVVGLVAALLLMHRPGRRSRNGSYPIVSRGHTLG